MIELSVALVSKPVVHRIPIRVAFENVGTGDSRPQPIGVGCMNYAAIGSGFLDAVGISPQFFRTLDFLLGESDYGMSLFLRDFREIGVVDNGNVIIPCWTEECPLSDAGSVLFFPYLLDPRFRAFDFAVPPGARRVAGGSNSPAIFSFHTALAFSVSIRADFDYTCRTGFGFGRIILCRLPGFLSQVKEG